jgi:hypothetical protein
VNTASSRNKISLWLRTSSNNVVNRWIRSLCIY